MIKRSQQNLEISGEKEGKNERMDSAEKGLLVLVGEEEEDEQVNMREGFFQEMRRLGYIAGPMVAVNSSMYFLQVISIMMVGHLGELFLSSTAIAVSFCSVTGFSLVVRLSSLNLCSLTMRLALLCFLNLCSLALLCSLTIRLALLASLAKFLALLCFLNLCSVTIRLALLRSSTIRLAFLCFYSLALLCFLTSLL